MYKNVGRYVCMYGVVYYNNFKNETETSYSCV